MSSIATFAFVPERALPALVKAARGTREEYDECLRANAGASVTFPWAGIILVTALTYLQEVDGIDLMTSDHDAAAAELSRGTGGTYFVLTAAHRAAYLDRLAILRFAEHELRDYFNALHESDESDVGRPLEDAARALREVLGQVAEGNVVLVMVA